ncbi:MAG: Holliday junction branch migration protein RuvA [Clostridia bacterium]
MIGKLRGRLDEVTGEGVVVDVGGVGYQVKVGMKGASRLGAPGERVVLFIHTHVREESLDLYGFISRGELSTFELLLGVSGVGPRMALAILDTLDADGVRRALASGDAKLLTRAPGVGKKTAERLILELGDRVADVLQFPASGGGVEEGGPASEALEALAALGFGRAEALEAISSALEGSEDPQVEELVRRSLALLSGEGGKR